MVDWLTSELFLKSLWYVGMFAVGWILGRRSRRAGRRTFEATGTWTKPPPRMAVIEVHSADGRTVRSVVPSPEGGEKITVGAKEDEG